MLNVTLLHLHPLRTTAIRWHLRASEVFWNEDASRKILDTRGFVGGIKCDGVRRVQNGIIGPFNSIQSFDDYCTGIVSILVSKDNEPVVWTIFSPSTSDFDLAYPGIGGRAASKDIECGRHFREIWVM